MEIIYKGTLYTVPVTSPKELSGARLYNLATHTRIEAALKDNAGEDDNSYVLTISPEQTASIPQGIYNLELFSMDADDNPIIEAYYENYAKVKESSFTQDYA